MVVLMVAGVAGGCHHADVYPPEVVQNFLSACQSRTDQRVCRCALDAIEGQFSLEEFQAFEARMRHGEAPREIMNAVADCRR